MAEKNSIFLYQSELNETLFFIEYLNVFDCFHLNSKYTNLSLRRESMINQIFLPVRGVIPICFKKIHILKKADKINKIYTPHKVRK